MEGWVCLNWGAMVLFIAWSVGLVSVQSGFETRSGAGFSGGGRCGAGYSGDGIGGVFVSGEGSSGVEAAG